MILGMEPGTLVITLITGFFTWTATVVALTLWLHGKFRSLEVAFYRGLGRHRKEIDRVLNEHSGRIQRLEILVTGSTLARFVDLSPENDDEE